MSGGDGNYWIGRWQRGETGWHQTEVEPNLVERFKDIQPTRVFVPLCGKSMDLTWLASQGHEVVGVELSEMACRGYFEENGLKFTETREGDFLVFRGGAVTIFNGDYFKLTPEQLGKLGSIYDRAALIALPRDFRTRYAARMIELVRACANPGFRLLQIVLARTPHDENGPPYSVPSEEIDRLYARDMSIEPLSREKVELGPGRDGDFTTEECVYWLKPAT